MKILVPTDFSDNANNALTFAKKISSGRNDVQITLLFAYYAVYDFAAHAIEIVETIETDSQKAMKKAVSDAKIEGIAIDYQIVQGTVATSVTSKAYKEDYDLIVMGTQGASGIKKNLIGTNTAHVIKDSQVPVLAIPSQSNWKKLNEIIVGVELDGKENLFYKKLIALTSSLGFPYHFFNLKVSSETEDLISLEDFQRNFKLTFPNIDFTVDQQFAKSVIDGIEEQLKEKPNSILVMFYKKKSFFEYMFNSSNSIAMAYHSSVPLLVLK
ncbi:universal stress protein [Belliella sp. DSM 107340]|uniref:Universal stress protein n=1 Tax=Belliella calami TaxID=2923436 RepID=A0ABS9ULE2_9BACT|nr:universal stress protein [Belliella calami]MCH7397194.1 universal stress protein [Belliella calami]